LNLLRVSPSFFDQYVEAIALANVHFDAFFDFHHAFQVEFFASYKVQIFAEPVCASA
jgi:hypothetical protein